MFSRLLASPSLISRGGGLALAVFLLAGVFLQSSVAQQVTTNTVRVSDFPEVTTLVTVTNQAGDPVQGLTAQDFDIEEDGTPQTITNFVELGTTGQSNVSTSIVLDGSGSMSGSKISDAKTAAKTFINNLVGGDRASVVEFGVQATVQQNFTSDKSLLDNAIDGITASASETVVYDGAIRGIDEVALEANSRAVLVLTDGNDTASSNTPQDVIDRANQAGVPVYTIALGSSPNTQPLQEIADKTGGRFFQAPSSSQLSQIYQEISNQLGNRYEITYSTTNSSLDGTQRDLNVDASFGMQNVSTTTTYTAPSARADWAFDTSTDLASLKPGDRVVLEVLFLSILDLFRATLSLDYTPEDLIVKNVQPGGILNNPDFRSTSISGNGQINVGIRNTGGSISQEGPLLRVEFEATDDVDNPLLGISNVDATDSDGNPIAVSAPTGLVTIKGTAVNQSSQQGAVAGATVTVFDEQGNVESTGKTDPSGDYQVRVPDDEDYSFEVTDVPGRVEGVDLNDVLQLFSHSVTGSPAFTPFEQNTGDVNADGLVNISDAFSVYQKFFSPILFEFDTGKVVSEQESVSLSGQPVDRDLSYAPAGDVTLDGCFGIGCQGTVTSLSKSTSLALESATEDVTVKPGASFEVPVRVGQHVDLGAFQLSVDYSSDHFQFNGIEDAGKELKSNAEDGEVTLGWFDEEAGNNPLSLQSGDRLLSLKFQASESASGEQFEIEEVGGEFVSPKGASISNLALKLPNVETAADEFALRGNSPNPFGEITNLRIDVPTSGRATVKIYNSLGQLVRTQRSELSPGTNQSIKIDGDNFSSGTYFYRVQVDTGSDTYKDSGRMTVVR